MSVTPAISGQESEPEVTLPDLGNLAAELDAPDDVVQDEVSPETPVTPEAKAEEGTPEVKLEEAKSEEVTPPSDEPSEAQLQLIQTIRQLRRDQALAIAKLERQEAELQQLKQRQTQQERKVDEDEDLLGIIDKKAPEAKIEPVQLAEIEKLQQDLVQLGQQRGSQLTTLVEAMSFNPAYADVKEVCSRSNLNDLVDAMAIKVAEDQNIDHTTAALRVETAIWRLDNPYDWMYKTIKANHPRYAEKPAATATPKEETPTPAPTEKGREPKPAEAPASIAPIGPTDPGAGGGWTAAKLDAMDEIDYGKVPENIRQMYIAGQLK